MLLGSQKSHPQGPHSQILMMGGSDRGSYFIPKKITTSVFSYPKKSLPFLAYPKKSLSSFFATPKKSLCFFSRPKKIPAPFIDRKNHLWPNFQTKKITRNPPSLKYVSGVPGFPPFTKVSFANFVTLYQSTHFNSQPYCRQGSQCIYYVFHVYPA